VSPTPTELLRRAAIEPAEPTVTLRPLPEPVVVLLQDAGASPRLAAHLRAVHDVACQLTAWLSARYPEVEFDADAVHFGAATHDIGKAIHPDELSGPGSAHEPDGYQLLVAAGVAEPLARFARPHAAWTATDATIEDQLVALADKIWKARRQEDLEQLLVTRLTASAHTQPWEAFIDLDDELTALAADAERRLNFQASYPTE
jgi:hypothetical protein